MYTQSHTCIQTQQIVVKDCSVKCVSNQTIMANVSQLHAIFLSLSLPDSIHSDPICSLTVFKKVRLQLMVVNKQVYRGGPVLKYSLNVVFTGLVFTLWPAVCLVSSMCCWLKLVSRMILSWKWRRLMKTSLVRFFYVVFLHT